MDLTSVSGIQYTLLCKQTTKGEGGVTMRLEQVQIIKSNCGECGRVFDLQDKEQANEYYYGHDCEI